MSFLDEAGLRTLWGRTTSKIDTIKAEVVSYTGTGSAGRANPTSVTFSKAPQVIIMLGYCDTKNVYWSQKQYYDDNAYSYMLPTAIIPTEYTRSMGFGHAREHYIYGKKSADGKTFSWYSYSPGNGEGTALQQCNGAGHEYYVLGLFTETVALGDN